MSTIASLNVMLTASVGGFSSAMKGAVAPVQALGGAINSISSHIFSLTGALAGIAGGAGFTMLLKNSMESIAATGRLSDRLGISTQKLSGMQYAARLAGVGTEELTTGLEKMLKSLSTAASEGGPAAAALAQMGLDAKQLASVSPDQAFEQIATGLKNIQNPADRARVTVELFGKAGQQLLPLLMQGADGIKAAEVEAAKLGVTFSRVDAAKVELANQSFVRLQAVLQGAAQTLAIELAPFIEAAANKLTALASSGRGASAYINEGFGTTLQVLAELTDFLAVVEAGWQMLRSGASFAIGGIIDGLAYVLDGLDWLLKKLGQTTTGWGQSGHQLAAAFYDTGKEAFQKAGQDWDEFMSGKNSKAAAGFMAGIQESSQKAAQSIAADAAKLNGAGADAEDWAKKLQKAAEDAKKVQETLDGLQKDIATFGQTDSQKKLFDLQALGATPEQLASAQKMVAQLEAMGNAKKATDSIVELEKELRQLGMTDAQKKLDDLKLPGVDPGTLDRVKQLAEKLDAMKEGKSVFDETRTPMEKYESQITKLGKLLNSGAINWDTYGRAVRSAREQLEKAAETKSPDLLDSGSAEADKYLYQRHNAHAFDFSTGVQNQQHDDGGANKDALEKQQYTEQYQSRLLLQDIKNAISDSNAQTSTVVDIA